MPDSTMPTLSAVIALINETSERNAVAIKEAFEVHEKVTEERDKYQRLQFNVMHSKLDAFAHEQTCKDAEQTKALEAAIMERRKDFAQYKEEVNTTLDDFKGDITVISTRVEVLENAPTKNALSRFKQAATILLSIGVGLLIAWGAKLLGLV